jgi:predicted permease
MALALRFNLSPPAAVQCAGPLHTHHRGLTMSIGERLASWLQEFRYALRSLRGRPAFSLTVIATLALGIGANAAIFSVVDSALIRPLPYAAPDRLVHLWETFESKVDNRSEASYPDYLDWRARTHSFATLAGYHGGDALLGGSQPMSIESAKATANFFDVLGVSAELGRTFAPGEDEPGAPVVVLLTHGLWQRQFAGDPAVIGRTISLNGAAATVIGVLPSSFTFAREGAAELWVPIDRSRATREQRGNHWLNVVGRLKPGVTIAAAQQDLSRVMHELARQNPEDAERDGSVVDLRTELVGSVRGVLLLLYAGVAVVLLIACVNVANLLLMRGADREREIAIRVALGAGRGRVIRQLVSESLLLAFVGGVLGVAVAALDLRAFVAVLPAHQLRGLPALASAAVGARSVVYALLLAIGAGVLFGVLPAIRLTTPALSDALKHGQRGSSGGAGRLRDALVAGEIALTMILSCGALLFARSVARLLAIDPGFRAEQVMTTIVTMPSTRRDAASQIAAYQRLVEQARAIPQVSSAALVSRLPLDFGNSLGFAIVGQPRPEPGHEPSASYRQTSGAYFGTMGIPVEDGRVFAPTEDAAAPLVVVVNRTFVGAYLSGRAPIGQRVALGRDTATIVGVVGDVPIGAIDARIPPTMYLPYAKLPQATMALAVRTTLPPEALSRSLHTALAAADPSAAMTAVKPMTDLIVESPSVFLRRLPLYLVGAFAMTALLLAIVGIYGVVSYSVAQRTREMGIRVALGAEPRRLIGLVLRHGGRMAVVGVVAGTVGAIALGRFADKMLYGVRATDPSTYAVVGAALVIVALASTLAPARRATKVDPVRALREE